MFLRRHPAAYPAGVFLASWLCTVDAGAQAVLDGIPIPRDRLIAFVMIGHSNLAGRTNKPVELRKYFYSTHPRAWNFNIVDDYTPAGPHHAWIPAYPMIHRDIRAVRDNLGTIAGPSMAFLKGLADRFPGTYFGVIQNAESMAAVEHYLNNSNYYKSAPWKGPPLYSQIIEAAREARKTATLGGVIAFLGATEKKPERFSNDVISLMANIRRDLEEPDLPLLLSEWEQGATGSWSPNTSRGQEVVAATRDLPEKISRCYVIPTEFSKDIDQYMNDDHHFNFAGYLEWADVAVNLIAQNGLVAARIPDTQPPSVPANLAAFNAGVSRIQIQWTASIDNDLVRNYIVYSGGDSLGVAGSANFLFAGAKACTTYEFSVRAVDFSDNRSPASGSVIHSSGCSGDVIPPTTPTGLNVEDIGSSSLTLAWTASSDDSGVSGYHVYRGSVLEGTASGVRFTVRGLLPDTTYQFTVVAVDAAGNRSDPSAQLSVSTRSLDVASIPLRVNVGGGSVGEYREDKPWVDPGDFGFSGTSTLQACPAAGIYATARTGELDYKVSVPEGYYRVSLQFMECGAAGAGQRVFSVDISGTQIEAVDIFGAAGANTEYILSRDVLVKSGRLEISLFSTGTGSPILSGLMVEEVPAFTIEYPNGGETIPVGSTIRIRWTSNVYLSPDALFTLSMDGGRSWYSIGNPITFDHVDWGNYPWQVPDSIAGIPLFPSRCLIRIADYNYFYSDKSDAEFVIAPPTGIRVSHPQDLPEGSIALVRHGAVPQFRITALWPDYMVRVAGLDGKSLGVFRGQGPGTVYFDLGGRTGSVFLVSVQGNSESFHKLIVFPGN